ncbi:MAG: UvrD-helicase domain-containing protein [Bacteroidales bacterium]|nr:UvrD-helicase domain-containing protein [Bacteroidales bacterium]
MIHNYLNDLNDAQKQAVINTDGPSLIIAGAGAGKTRVLTYRIAHLLSKGIPAPRILALTFTNKAAREMKERITSIAGFGIARYLWMGTFHSIFARILRIEGNRLGYKSNYTIYDSTDSKSLIRTIIRELNLDDKIYKPGVIACRISNAKNNLISAAMYAENLSLTEYDRSVRMPLLPEIYRHYASRCFKSNAMDFDDLLLNTNILLKDFPDVLEKYQEKFSYILVDEYQDTNYSQYLIVKQLAAAHQNICVVGDDAQSIYSFRGARIENILEFRNDYPGYRLFKLERNYRSTQTIVNAANTIIERNEGQIRKTVYSENEPGEKIRIMEAITDSEEGFNIASDIFEKRLSLQLNWSDFAILYRTNAQSRIFEETLRRKNIPYKIYGGLSFYERKEIKDILAYFRMVINPSDEEALKRTINYPRRGIGDTTVSKIFELASLSGVSPWMILQEAEKYPGHFNAGTIKKLLLYRELIATLSEGWDKIDAFRKAREIAFGSGIIKELRDGKSPEEISRYENLEELLNAIKIFTESAETNGEPATLDAYMANVALLTDQDTEKAEDREKVTLMTMHSAKGLEFGHVYVAGMEDTLFPSPLSSGNPREIEEERRLFYVAVTRAKKMATLSYALNRYKWGNLERCNPSRFLREIDQKFLDYAHTKASKFKSGAFTGNKSSSFREEASPPYPAGNRLKRIVRSATVPVSAFDGSLNEEYKEGDMVEHERFGRGEIITLEGETPNMTATVDFRNGGKKKLLLRFAKLRKV